MNLLNSFLSNSLFFTIYLFTSITISLTFSSFYLYIYIPSEILLLSVLTSYVLLGIYCFKSNTILEKLFFQYSIIFYLILIVFVIWKTLNLILFIPLFMGIFVINEINNGKLRYHFNKTLKTVK